MLGVGDEMRWGWRVDDGFRGGRGVGVWAGRGSVRIMLDEGGIVNVLERNGEGFAVLKGGTFYGFGRLVSLLLEKGGEVGYESCVDYGVCEAGGKGGRI